jgi:hypothetical protein
MLVNAVNENGTCGSQFCALQVIRQPLLIRGWEPWWARASEAVSGNRKGKCRPTDPYVSFAAAE